VAAPPEEEKLVMRWPVVLLLAAVAQLSPRAAAAVSIAVVPSQTSLNVGDSLSVTLEASALAGAAVGAFDVDLGFDPARFSLSGVTFGSALGDVGAGEQLTDVVSGTGSVSLGTVSLLDPVTLAGLQTDPLALVTLVFEAVGAGTGAFTIDAALLSDAFAAALAIDGQTGASVEVVPEPALALLLVFTAGAFGRRGRA
jgi:hypothetical protein